MDDELLRLEVGRLPSLRRRRLRVRVAAFLALGCLLLLSIGNRAPVSG